MLRRVEAIWVRTVVRPFGGRTDLTRKIRPQRNLSTKVLSEMCFGRRKNRRYGLVTAKSQSRR